MKKLITNIFWLILCLASLYYAYTYSVQTLNNVDTKLSIEILSLVFIAGCSFAAFIFNIIFNKTYESLNIYKRELEKESIDSTESSSRIKVLESKIQVLEKALDEALKK
ncbi:MAG: hypothetical protein NC200_00510 [Candidatus Gastranaerophilales bacterium]|nr:hypothetical protein [Candidatus Gastranaerophilales bacterium]